MSDESVRKEAMRPTPGSDAAIAAGCICPRIDNNRGKWPPFPQGGYYIDHGCQVHWYPQEAT